MLFVSLARQTLCTSFKCIASAHDTFPKSKAASTISSTSIAETLADQYFDNELSRPGQLQPRMKTPSFLRKVVESIEPMLDKIRTDTVPGVFVSLKGRKDKLKDRPNVTRGLNVVEIVVLILVKLEYHDLRNVYNACAGFRKIVGSFVTLRRILFLAPDYVCRPHWIPLKIFNHLPIDMYLGHPILNFRVFELNKKQFEQLREEPRLELEKRLIIQPPLKYMRISVGVLKEPLFAGGWKGEVE